MQTNKVHISSCESYSLDEVTASIRACFDSFGGVEAVIGRGKRVAVKPNLVTKRKPEQAVNTHPVMLEALTHILAEYGNTVLLAESPGGFYTEGALRSSYKFNGFEEAALRCGAVLNYDTSVTEVAYLDGEICKKLNIISPIIEADCVISLARLKTHAMCYLSAGVKNLFGCVGGTEKFEMHARYSDNSVFANMLLDIYGLVKPQFTIVDAVTAMEGNGPTSGFPRDVGCIVASDNGCAADLVCSRMVGYADTDVPMIVHALRRGLCGEPELIGADIGAYTTPDFKKPDSFYSDPALLLGIFDPKLLKPFEPRPVVHKGQCTGCGVCKDSCPVKTIEIKSAKAIIHRDKCIKCYCCQELCPSKAVGIRKSIFGRRTRNKTKI